MSGGDSGDGGAAQAQQAEESRKAALRAQINQMYGFDNPAATPTQAQFTTTAPVVDIGDGSGFTGGGSNFDQAGFDKAMSDFKAAGSADPTAQAARDAESKAETSLGDATRGFYNDQLQHASTAAFRNNRFALADRGTLGGSAQIDSERELSRDNTLGATRVADQVASAISGLKNSQEQERLQAINLVNAGSGPDAVQSAQAGLQRSLDNAQSTTKANITGDLFSAGADQYAAQNNSLYNPMLLASYQKGLGTFFNPGAGTARTTPT